MDVNIVRLLIFFGKDLDHLNREIGGRGINQRRAHPNSTDVNIATASNSWNDLNHSPCYVPSASPASGSSA